MFSYWIHDASTSVPDNLSVAYEKARMRQRQRKLKEDERIEVKRPCPSDPGMIPCFDGKTTASGPALKTNRVFRLRVERAKREVKLLEEERENVCDTDACGYKEPKLASSSSSYILPSPSVAGIPYIPTSSHPPQTCPATVPGRSNKLDLIAALTQSAWTDIKARLHAVLQPLINMLSTRKQEDKSTSTSEDSELNPLPARPDVPGPRVDSWQKGSPKKHRCKSSPCRTRASSSSLKRFGPNTANIARITRDPKTKVVTVWTVEKPPSPKAAALRPGPRPWRF